MSEKIENNGADGEHVIDLLSAYMDDMLGESERTHVREHLKVCEDCRADYVELQATQQLLQSMPEMPPPRAFTLTPEMVEAKQGFWQRLLAPANAPKFAWGSGLAFTVVALMFFGSFLLGQSSASTSATVAQLKITSSNEAAGESSGVAAAIAPEAMATPATDSAMALPTTDSQKYQMHFGGPTAVVPPSGGTGGGINDAAAEPTMDALREPVVGLDAAQDSSPTPPALGILSVPETTEQQVTARTTSSPSTNQLSTRDLDLYMNAYGTPAASAGLEPEASQAPPGLVQPTSETGTSVSIWVVGMLGLAGVGVALAMGALLARRRT